MSRSLPWAFIVTLYKVLAGLLVVIAVALLASHLGPVGTLDLPAGVSFAVGLVAGVLIGIVAALMGVAGGELLIPTIVLLYVVDIKLAGSLSLAVSLPTMLVAFARYSQDASFRILRTNKVFVVAMTAGSITGTLLGACCSALCRASSSFPPWCSYCCSPPSRSGDTNSGSVKNGRF